MPSDVTGVSVYRQDRHEFEFKAGPAFTDVLLADEINRATPRAQSCLLECMEERQISSDGITRALPPTFFVIATQNPAGFHGTYPLPEAQVDRFLLRLRLGYPAAESEVAMMAERIRAEPIATVQAVMDLPTLASLQSAVQNVEIKPEVLRYIAELVRATRAHKDVMLGCSPRGSLALMRASQAVALLSGKNFVTPDHVKRIAVAALAHRLLLKQAADSAAADRVITELMTRVAVPVAAIA
jgi:MoxR-like ATPase